MAITLKVFPTSSESGFNLTCFISSLGDLLDKEAWPLCKPYWLPGHHDALWYVLVEVTSEESLPKFYIFHSSEVGPWFAKDHADYLERNNHKSDSNGRKLLSCLASLLKPFSGRKQCLVQEQEQHHFQSK